MTRASTSTRLPINSSTDILSARQQVREVAARLGFDHFDQVQLATGISEISREMVGSGGGELELCISPALPRRLVIRAISAALGDDSSDPTPAVVAARRLIGPPFDGETRQTALTFSRLLPTAAPPEQVALALSGGTTDPYSELSQQDADLLRLVEEVRRRDTELESVNRELEETNRGVLALYAELDDKAEAVRRMSDERSRFTSNVTHELRTPLSSILALCRLLLTQEGSSLEDAQAKQIAYIQKSAQDLLDFVSDLLDLAKVEAGKVSFRAAPFELVDVFGALRGMFRPLSADANVPLTFEVANIPTMDTDENKVTHILRNLISNALKFTEQGEIHISATHEPDTDEVVFVVTDTGIGIPAADLNRIFDEFVQLDSRGSRRERSSGLGLPLSRKLAVLMGGWISVESELGLGSRFTLRLPRTYAGDVPPGTGISGYVLVVDDDHISRYVAKEQLERLGWRVIEAAEGEMALKLAQEADCRAIVLDLVMPGMTGFEVLERLGDDRRTAAIPVVIRTSLSVNEIDAARVARAAAVFSKSDDSMRSLVDVITARTGRRVSPAAKGHQP